MNDLVPQDRIRRINELYMQVQQTVVTSIETIVAIGEELIAVKSELDHGQFQPWLESNFRFTAQTARRWMSVAEKKKDVLKQLKGGNLANLSDAYSVKTASLALSGPAKASAKPTPKRIGSSNGSPDHVPQDWPSSPRLTKHKVLARGGEVHVLAQGSIQSTLVFKGTFYLDPTVGMEWAHRDALASIDKGLQLVFENYFNALEMELTEAESQPVERPVAPAQTAIQPPASPRYKGALDEED